MFFQIISAKQEEEEEKKQSTQVNFQTTKMPIRC